LIGTVGLDAKSGIERFSFNTPYLWEGIDLVLVALGIFGIPEVIDLAGRKGAIAKAEEFGRGYVQGIFDCFQHWWLLLRTSIIGAWVGFLPGLGSSVADWFAYAHAVQTEKNRENFGKGDVRGVIASEGSNNAKEGGDYIPTLAFGIPGGTSTALVLTAFIAVSIKPGPDMLTSQLNLTFAVHLDPGHRQHHRHCDMHGFRKAYSQSLFPTLLRHCSTRRCFYLHRCFRRQFPQL